jgi:NADPH:quinone reductase-like Zn-dependent oxidoreductase/predicted 3-demethylubiquinone-9 3-methyltransferase (glyoxalase superfamily)
MNIQKINPFLWYSNQAEEASAFYTGIFPDSRVVSVTAMPTDSPSGPAGTVKVVEFVLCGQTFIAMSAGGADAFNHSVSFVVNCEDQKEVDGYWNALLAGGGEPEACGWLKDRYGVRWQIVPTIMFEMMADPDKAKAKRACDAMMTMIKFDIAKLKAAFDSMGSPTSSTALPATALPAKMKAVQVDAFGGVSSLKYRDVLVPDPGPGEVLVRVAACGVGPWDAWVRSGNSVLDQPLPLTPGSDISGTVVKIGKDVTAWAVGDEVYGVTNGRFTGAYADFALAEAGRIAAKPARLGHTEAASVPVIAVTAWQMLFDHGRFQPGQTVLVHGASGSVGAFAVQLAAQAGAHVIGVASRPQADYVRQLGAAQIIESRTGSFDDIAGKVDVTLDLVGGEALAQSYALMKPGGVIVSAVTQPDQQQAQQHGITAAFMLVDVTTAALQKLSPALDTGKLVTRVGEVLPLADARIAHEMLDGRAHKPGKIVLTPGG